MSTNPYRVIVCPGCDACLDEIARSPGVDCPCGRFVRVTAAQVDRIAADRIKQTKLFPPEQRRLFDDR